MTPSTRRRIAVGVVQYGIGLLALGWLLEQVELARLATLVGTVDRWTAVALLTVTGIGLLARFTTWHVLLNRVQRTDLVTAAGVDLVVNFVNQLLPSRLTGRIAAPVVVRGGTGLGTAQAVAVVGVHTGLYATLYGIGALAGVAVGVGRFSTGLLALLAITTALYLLAGGFVLLAGANLPVANGLVATVTRVVDRLPLVGGRLAGAADSLPAFAEESAGWFRSLAGDPRVVLPYAVGFAVALLVAPGVRVWLLLASFGTVVEPVALLPIYLLVAYSVTLLPLTPGGIGVSEATATAVFVSLGVPAAVVVPVVFVDRTLGVYLPALAGWYPSIRLDVAGIVAE